MTSFTPEAMSPILAFRYQVDFTEIDLTSGTAGAAVSRSSGSFSECTGLEASMEPKVINEGGRNYGSAQRAGRVSFGTVVLKRGLTSSRDAWQWFEMVSRGSYAYRLNAEITVLGPEIGPSGGQRVEWRWKLLHCLPIKFKAPDLNAKGSEVAIEEIHLAHEGLLLVEASTP